MSIINVKKRDGSIEVLDLNKIHRVLAWATEDLNDVYVSEIETKSGLQFYDGISTSEIHDILINTTSKLISEYSPDYQFVATKLAILKLRKEIFNSINIPSLLDVIKNNVSLEKYDSIILEKYTQDEIEYFDAVINHDNDYKIPFVGLSQLLGKYLIQDKVTKQKYETPQISFMVISMFAFMDYEKSIRKQYVKDFYKLLSEFKISLPTPIMAGFRTQIKQFSSCVLIDCDDSLNSISASSDAILKYVSRKAGIGLNVGRIRALNSSIRNGSAYHTGLIPFIKYFEAAVNSCSQGSTRKGSSTLYFPIWHLEIQDLLVLKNNKGTDENRCRSLDFCVQFNKLFYERVIAKEKFTLFSPSDVPGLYEAFFQDQDLFKELYLKYEKNKKIRKTEIDANELFELFLIERLNTGRIYLQNADHSNTNSAFDSKDATIYMSNLCSEITLPTIPLNESDDLNAEIALCTLAAVNVGKIRKLQDLEYTCELLVRCLDSILTYQNYPLKASKKSTDKHRPLGIGINNYAYYLAKNGFKANTLEARNLTHELFEALQYYCLKASNKLSQEFGKCDAFENTTYSKGILPIDRYKKDIDELYTVSLNQDWELLRSQIKDHGLRNSTVSALMPCEVSSQLSGSSNGIELLKDYTMTKVTKDSVSTFIAPNLRSLKSKYTIVWDIENEDVLKLNAIMQKFVDQSISTNTFHDPRKFVDGKISMSKLKREILYAYKLGIKTLYYANTYVENIENSGAEDNGCEGGACKL